MTSKLKLKTSKFEFEWETGDQITPEIILSLFETLSTAKIDEQLDQQPNTSNSNGSISETVTETFTTSMAVNRLDVKTGPDLFRAALAKLQLSDGLKYASRKQITDEMKTLPSVWNETIGKNLSQTIKSLSGSKKKILNEPKADHYSLTESAIKEFSDKLFS